MSSPPPTLLSTVQRFTTPDALPSHAVHPFSSNSQSIAQLRDLLAATSQLTQSLNLHLATPPTNPKHVSLLRQHSAIAHTLHIAEQTAKQTADALRARPDSTAYGEDIPHDRAILPEWCAARIEACGTAAGMETFREGRTTVVCGGKVLVVDIDLDVSAGVRLARLKTSFAVGNSANTDGAPTLDAALARGVHNFLEEVQMDEETRDPVRAARLARRIVEQLKYLMVLDALAARTETEGGGVRWFIGIDELAKATEDKTREDALIVASSLYLSHTPLDIFISCTRALPLHYLRGPSLSFLVHLSPRAYLSLLRTIPSSSSSPLPSLATDLGIDIPLPHIYDLLSAHPRPEGATIATLVLTPSQSQDQSSPEISSADGQFPTTSGYVWTLDFTDSGASPGLVMSQGRMRAVERVLGVDDDMSRIMGGMGMGMGMMAFGMGSWVDLLLNPAASPEHPISPERYTTLYRSPTNAHPPLQLRLAAPEEPGFILERVPVVTMRQVWGVLEVVREQCWLNEILNSCQWAPEGLATASTNDPDENDTVPATDAELAAILTGTLTPRKIPVNVYLPSAPPPSPVAHIVMSVPERAPVSGLVEIGVAHDTARPRGVRVEVRGGLAFGMGADGGALEEVCRRGGVLGLAGRVWAEAGGVEAG